MGDIFVFDDFELDAARFELRRAGQCLEVQPKALRLLLYLVTHRERAVPGDELLRALWPETTVGAGSVKRAVLAARHALGDRTETSATIRTVRGLGYQFARAVRVLSRPAESVGIALPTAELMTPLVETVSAAAARPLFVGREPVMGLLESHLTAALEGTSGCVLLHGAPGIGKTRTAEEFWLRARARGVATWLGPSTAVDGVPAFWPMIQVLRDALRDRGAPELRALMGPGVAEIVQALPDLRHVLPDPPEEAPLTTRSERFRFFDSITTFLRRAAERRPIVLGFDDLHRADSATLQLLGFMLRQLDRAQILIVGTFRRELVASGEPPLLAALAREARTRSIELPGFDREAIARYVAITTGSQPPASAVDALQEQTAGNPLFVRQLVESWRATHAADGFAALEHASHSCDLQGAIGQHLEVVPEACRELLRVAAVLGREFSSGLLSRVLDEPIESVWARLSQAEATQLIEPCTPHGRFRFTHSLIREALYRQLSFTERARLHGQAGRALEAQGVGQNYVLLAELTRHFVLAAPVHDRGQALPYTLRAAELALARLAYEEAAAHFQCALQLREYAEPDRVERMWLLFRKGDALARTTELAAARAALFEAAALARELRDAETLFQSATLIAARPETGAVDAAQLAVLRDALAALPEADPRRVLLKAALAKSLVYDRSRAERVELARDALQRGRALDDLRLKTEVLIRCHEALIGPEHLRERVTIAAELSQLARQRGDASAQLRAAATQIETYIESGDLDGMDSALSSMETLAEHVREPYFRWHAKAIRGTQALIYGRAQLAEQHMREALEFGAPLGEELARHMYCTQVVGLLMMRGRFQEVEPLAHEMTVRHPGVKGWLARVGVLDCLLGRRDAAQRCLDQIMERNLDWIESEPFPLSGLCSITDLCGLLGDANAAGLLYPALLPYAEHLGSTHLGAATYGPVTRCLAMLAAVRGDIAGAEEHARRALKTASALRSPTFVAMAALTYAQVLLAGRPDARVQASSLLAKALQNAERSQLDGISFYCRELAKLYAVPILQHTPQA